MRDDVPALIAAADIFVLPTLGDVLPTVLSEAMAARKPIVASDVGGVPEMVEHAANGLLVPPADAAQLADACAHSLYTLRQSRLMLGREMDRLVRVFLHGDTAPDTVLLADENGGLVVINDGALRVLLDKKKPAALEAGGYYLIDPLGNLVIYFRPDIDPSAMVEDIKHLLELSRIG